MRSKQLGIQCTVAQVQCTVCFHSHGGGYYYDLVVIYAATIYRHIYMLACFHCYTIGCLMPIRVTAVVRNRSYKYGSFLLAECPVKSQFELQCQRGAIG